MNKRLLFRNKIVRLYEDDIWGIFFRKQKKRDLFFRKIGYQLFLEIFRKNMRAIKPTTFAWKKKIYACAKQCNKNTKVQQKYKTLLLKQKLKYCLNYNMNIQHILTKNSEKKQINFFLYVKKNTNKGIETVLRWADPTFLIKKISFFEQNLLLHKIKHISCFKNFKITNNIYLKICSVSSHFIILFKQSKKINKVFFYLPKYRVIFLPIFNFLLHYQRSLTNIRTFGAQYNVFKSLKNTYLNYFVLPLYFNIYFLVLKKIYFFVKSMSSFLQLKANKMFAFFEDFLNSANILKTKQTSFEIFCRQISPLFVKMPVDTNSLQFGVNFFPFFNCKQISIKGQGTKKIYNLRKLYKNSLFLLINYFSLLIKIQKKNLNQKYQKFFFEISDVKQPLRLQNMAGNLEINLQNEAVKQIIYTLQYFRFFLYNKRCQNTILYSIGTKSIYPLFEKSNYAFKRFKRRNAFSVKYYKRAHKLRKIAAKKYIKLGYTFQTKKKLFFLPLTLRYCLKDKTTFTQNYFKAGLKKKIKKSKKKLFFLKKKKKILKNKTKQQTLLLQQFLRKQKIELCQSYKKNINFSFFFKYLCLTKFIFENLIRMHIAKLIGYIKKKNMQKTPLMWLAEKKDTLGTNVSKVTNVTTAGVSKKKKKLTPYTPAYAVVKKTIVPFKQVKRPQTYKYAQPFKNPYKYGVNKKVDNKLTKSYTHTKSTKVHHNNNKDSNTATSNAQTPATQQQIVPTNQPKKKKKWYKKKVPYAQFKKEQQAKQQNNNNNQVSQEGQSPQNKKKKWYKKKVPYAQFKKEQQAKQQNNNKQVPQYRDPYDLQPEYYKKRDEAFLKKEQQKKAQNAAAAGNTNANTQKSKMFDKNLNNNVATNLLQSKLANSVTKAQISTVGVTQTKRKYSYTAIFLSKKNENLHAKKIQDTQENINSQKKMKKELMPLQSNNNENVIVYKNSLLTNEISAESKMSKTNTNTQMINNSSSQKQIKIARRKNSKKKNNNNKKVLVRYTTKTLAAAITRSKIRFKINKRIGKKMVKFKKTRKLNMRVYLREYMCGRIKTTKYLSLKKKLKKKPAIRWLHYYMYWRSKFTGKFLRKSRTFNKYYQNIAFWQKESNDQFVQILLLSQQRLWYGESYVKQLCLSLHARKLITKRDVSYYYAYWSFTNKTQNLYYKFLCFKNNIYFSLCNKLHTYVKLFDTKAVHITQKQRFRFIQLLPVLKKHIVFINTTFNNNNFNVFSFMQFILKTSKTKYILAKKLKHLAVKTNIRKYFIWHWTINQILCKKIKKSNLKEQLIARKRLLNQILIRKKKNFNFIFAASKKAPQKLKKIIRSVKNERSYSFFCGFIIHVLRNEIPKCSKIFTLKVKHKPKFLKQKTKPNFVFNTNLFFFDNQKKQFLKQWLLLIKNFKHYMCEKKFLNKFDLKKISLFLRLLKYVFFFKVKTCATFLIYLTKRLYAFNFSLKAQAHILYFFKKILINNKLMSRFFVKTTQNAAINNTVIAVKKKTTWSLLYIKLVNTCYKIFLKKKQNKKRNFFLKKKKILFWRWRNKFSIKRHFKDFLKHQFRIFFKTYYIFKGQSGTSLRYLKYMSKFSRKAKLRFLLKYSFRYNAVTHLQNHKFLSKKVLFFRADYYAQTPPRYLKLLYVTTLNLNFWLQIFNQKFILIKSQYNTLLKLYLVYVLKKKTFFQKISYLPRSVSSLFNFQASSFLFLKDAALPEYAFNTKWNTLYFLNDFYLYKQYKVYFYLFYKLWYLNQIMCTYLKYVKYVLYLQEKNKHILGLRKNVQAYYKFIIKNIFFRRLFNGAKNAHILPMFNLISNFSYCFKYWVSFIFKLFVDTLTERSKFELQTRVKKLKRIKFVQKTNTYLFLRQLLNLYLIKWTVFKWKKFFYVNKNLINTLAYARRRVRRLLYTVRSFFYQRYNKAPDSDSIFNTKLSDIINASDIKKEKEIEAKKSNKIFQEYVNLYIQKKQKFNTKKNHKNFELKHFLVKDTLQFKKTEYLLSFFASNHIYKYFNKLRRSYVNSLIKKKNNNNNKNNFASVKEYNSLFNFDLLKKYAIFLFKKIAKIKKQIRFFSLRKRKTTLDRMFTLDLYPVVKYVKKKTSFNSFYKYRMLKVWKFRKFYGCLTNYELNSICLKAYKYRGDIIIQFIILLEARLDTVLYRTGFVTSMFEARQLINHGNFLVNNQFVKKRSYVLKEHDLLSFDDTRINLYTSRLQMRLKTQGLLFWPPAYLEVNYKYILITFIYELLKINQIPYNFKLTGKDLNSILYYYY